MESQLADVFSFYQLALISQERYERMFNIFYKENRINVPANEISEFGANPEILTIREFCHQIFKNEIEPNQEKATIKAIEYLNNKGSIEEVEAFINNLKLAINEEKTKTYYLKKLYSNLAFSLDDIIDKIKTIPPYNKEYIKNLELLRKLYPTLNKVNNSEIPVLEILTYIKENKPELLLEIDEPEIRENREDEKKGIVLSNPIHEKIASEIQQTPKLPQIISHGFYFDKKNDSTNIETIIDRVWKILKKHKLIENRTKFSEFKKIFNYGKINEKTVWLGDKNQLSFFIKTILKRGIGYKNDRNRNKWEITVNCFKLSNQRDIKIGHLQRTIDPNPNKQIPILEACEPFRNIK